MAVMRHAGRGRAAGSSMRTSVPRPRALATAMRAAESLDDVPRDGRPSRCRSALGREVGIEDARQILPARCRRRGRATVDARRGGAVRRAGRAAGSTRPSGGGSRRATAWLALASMLTSAVPQALGVGGDGRDRAVEVQRDGGRRRRPAPRRAGIAAERVEVGRRKVEADRPREVEHVVRRCGSGARPPRRCRGRLARPRPACASSRRSVRSAVLMIISGLRISCAITVDSRPSEDSRSRCAASRWKRAIESVSVLKVGPAGARPRPPSGRPAAARSAA